MIIILKENTTPQELNNLTDFIKSHGLTPHISEGVHQTIMGLVGDTSRIDIESISPHKRVIVKTNRIVFNSDTDFPWSEAHPQNPGSYSEYNRGGQSPELSDNVFFHFSHLIFYKVRYRVFRLW